MNIERAVEWASKLSRAEMQVALLELLEEACTSEVVSFPSGSDAPYWGATGDPIVPGQKTWPEEEQ